MNRIPFLLAGALVLSGPLVAQSQNALKPDAAPMVGPAQFFAEPEWQRAFAYSFTPLAAVEPKPANEEITFFKEKLAPLLEGKGSQNPSFSAALNVLEEHLPQVKDTDTQALFNFTSGAICQQLATENSKDGTVAENYRRRAEQYYLTAIKLYPSYQRAEMNLGQLYMQMDGDDTVEKSVPHLQNAIKLGAQGFVPYALLGYAYFQEKRYFAAESAVKQALALQPNDQNLRVLLAQILLLQDRFTQARALFRELVQKNPNKVEWWLGIVNTYIAQEDEDSAATVLELVRQMGGGTAPAYDQLGRIYMRRQTYDLAASVYLDALQKFPDAAANMFVGAAASLVTYSDFEDATKLIDAVRAKFGDKLPKDDNLTLLTLRSRIAIAQGNGEEAAKTLEEILKNDPDNAGALNTLGSYYGEIIDKKSGEETFQEPRDRERAIFLLKRAEDVAPDAEKVRAYITHAQILVRQQDVPSMQEAVSLLRRAQNIRNQDYVERYIQQIQGALEARTVSS